MNPTTNATTPVHGRPVSTTAPSRPNFARRRWTGTSDRPRLLSASWGVTAPRGRR